MSLSLLLDMAASGYGDRVALGSRVGGVTFEGLHRAAGGGAAVIARHDPAHVVFIGRNGPAYPQLLFASAYAGVPFAPLNYRLSQPQLLELLGELDRPLVIADADYLSMVDESYSAINTADFLAEADSTEPVEATFVDDEATAVLLFTSGTTAKPKAVVLRHANLTAYIFATVEFGNADPSEAALVSVPPYHVAAVGSALSNIYAGRRLVYLPDFDPATWLTLVRDEGVTSAMMVPTMLSRVVEFLDGAPAETPTLGQIAYGGARIARPRPGTGTDGVPRHRVLQRVRLD